MRMILRRRALAGTIVFALGIPHSFPRPLLAPPEAIAEPQAYRSPS